MNKDVSPIGYRVMASVGACFRTPARRPRPQNGQALPIGIALLLIGTLAGIVLYNSGQAALDKTRLANTADAAAYSGALMQSRALNFQAYTNRAMVANQVSIAQAVSLASWSRYGKATAGHISMILENIPFLTAIAVAIEQGMNILTMVTEPLASGILQFANIVNGGLSLAQEAMYMSTFAATPEIVDTIATATDERFDVNTAYTVGEAVRNINRWRQFTGGFAANDEVAMLERKDMIERSLDDFSAERNWNFMKKFLPVMPTMKVRLDRRGDTRLAMTKNGNDLEWEWQARDTQSLQTKFLVFDFPGFDWKGIETPIGMGMSYANSTNDDNPLIEIDCHAGSSEECGYFSDNRSGEKWAYENRPILSSGEDTQKRLKRYDGVRAYRSLSEETLDEEDPVLRLRVEVSMDLEQAARAHGRGIGRAEDSALAAPGDAISSVSVAEVYYQHPEVDADGNQRQQGVNGYNPYWDVRLARVSDADRALALALRSSGGSTSVPASGQGAGTGEFSIGEGVSPALADTGDGNSGASSLDSLVSQYANDQVDRVRDEIEQQILAVIQDAAVNILVSAVGNYVGIDLDLGEGAMGSLTEGFGNLVENEISGAVEDTLGDLVTDDAAAPYDDMVDDALAHAQAFEAEFERIQEEYARRLPEVWDEVREEMRTLAQPHLDEIARLREEIAHSSYREDSFMRKRLRSAISEQYGALAEINRQFRPKLVEAVMEMSRQISDSFQLTWPMAEHLVDQMIQFGVENVELPWDEEVADAVGTTSTDEDGAGEDGAGEVGNVDGGEQTEFDEANQEATIANDIAADAEDQEDTLGQEGTEEEEWNR